MKILHICLANYYADGHSYQENLLPEEHKRMGYEVEVIASRETFDSNNNISYINAKSYTNNHGIKITRLDYIDFIPFYLKKKLRKYKNLRMELIKSDPDIIFIHDIQFLSAYELVAYIKLRRKKKHIRVIADCHADFSNSARNFISYRFLHKIIYKKCAQKLNEVVDKFFGVLPSRVKFLNEVYDIPKSKIDFLNMGADKMYIDISNELNIRDKILNKYKLEKKYNYVLTGGRIDKYKILTIELMKLFNANPIDNVKLIIIGTVSNDLKDEFFKLIKESSNIVYMGFMKDAAVNEIIIISDIGVYLGRHSVLWEQSVGLGLPLILKSNEHEYLNHNNNILVVDSADDALKLINFLIDNENLKELKNNALHFTRLKFSYENIAIRSLQ